MGKIEYTTKYRLGDIIDGITVSNIELSRLDGITINDGDIVNVPSNSLGEFLYRVKCNTGYNALDHIVSMTCIDKRINDILDIYSIGLSVSHIGRFNLISREAYVVRNIQAIHTEEDVVNIEQQYKDLKLYINKRIAKARVLYKDEIIRICSERFISTLDDYDYILLSMLGVSIFNCTIYQLVRLTRIDDKGWILDRHLVQSDITEIKVRIHQ